MKEGRKGGGLRLIEGKKGISDALLWGPVLMLFFVAIVVGLIFMTAMNTAMQQTTFSNESKAITSDFLGDYSLIFDAMFVMLVLALFIGAGLLGLVIDTNPAVMFLALMLFILVLFIGGFFANAMADFAEQSTVVAFSAEFPMASFIFNHYVELLLFMGGLLTIIIYAKRALSG